MGAQKSQNPNQPMGTSVRRSNESPLPLKSTQNGWDQNFRVAGMVTRSVPSPHYEQLLLLPTPSVKMFLERFLDDPPPPHLKHLSLSPPPLFHPGGTCISGGQGAWPQNLPLKFVLEPQTLPLKIEVTNTQILFSEF